MNTNPCKFGMQATKEQFIWKDTNISKSVKTPVTAALCGFTALFLC